MRFITELPQDVIAILRQEYPDKSFPAAIKLFVRENNPRNGINDDKNNYYKKPASTQSLRV